MLAAVRVLDQELFDGAAGPVVVTLRAPPMSAGMAVTPGWLHLGDGSTAAELRLNPVMLQREPVDVLAVVAHELCHLVVGLREGHGPGWLGLMESIGLQPVRLGPDRYDHDVIPGGRLDVLAGRMIGLGWRVPSWVPREVAAELEGVGCPTCGVTAWAPRGSVLGCTGRLDAGHQVATMLPAAELAAIDAVSNPPVEDVTVICVRCGEGYTYPGTSAPDEVGLVWSVESDGWVCCGA